MKIRIKRLHPHAQIPSYGSLGAACFDLHAVEKTIIQHGYPTEIRTGLAFEVPDNHVMLVFSRSGHGFKDGIRLANCVGVIDSDYRGEVMVKLTKDESGPNFYMMPGDRMAQAMILPIKRVTFEEGEIDGTPRGAGGFGSTGR